MKYFVECSSELYATLVDSFRDIYEAKQILTQERKKKDGKEKY